MKNGHAVPALRGLAVLRRRRRREGSAQRLDSETLEGWGEAPLAQLGSVRGHVGENE